MAAIAWPGLTLIALVTLFGVYAIVDGVMAVLSVATHRERGRWWAVLLEGILGTGTGLAALVIPGITATVLVLLIGAWAILTGFMEVIAAFRLRREMEDEWLLGLTGILSLVFGLVIVAFPGAGALALVTLIGAYAIVFGLAMVLLGLRMRHPAAMPGRGLRLPV